MNLSPLIASGFLSEFKTPLISQEIGTSISVEFDITKYNDAFFKLSGINFPENLSRAVDKRKSEFLAGRACALQLLNDKNIPGQIAIGTNREPLFPSNTIVGSITHTNLNSTNLACAVVAPSQWYSGVGIDIEGIINEETYFNIRERIACPSELNLIKHLDLPDNIGFTILFSAKESFYKSAFNTVGRFFGFDAIEITTIDLEESSVQFSIKENLTRQLHTNKKLTSSLAINEKSVTTLSAIETENSPRSNSI